MKTSCRNTTNGQLANEVLTNEVELPLSSWLQLSFRLYVCFSCVFRIQKNLLSHIIQGGEPK